MVSSCRFGWAAWRHTGRSRLVPGCSPYCEIHGRVLLEEVRQSLLEVRCGSAEYLELTRLQQWFYCLHGLLSDCPLPTHRLPQDAPETGFTIIQALKLLCISTQLEIGWSFDPIWPHKTYPPWDQMIPWLPGTQARWDHWGPTQNLSEQGGSSTHAQNNVPNSSTSAQSQYDHDSCSWLYSARGSTNMPEITSWIVAHPQTKN